MAVALLTKDKIKFQYKFKARIKILAKINRIFIVVEVEVPEVVEPKIKTKINFRFGKLVVEREASEVLFHLIVILLFKRFRKTGSNDAELLKEIEKFNKNIIDETSRIFQNRAKSKDPKIFWQAVNSTLGKMKGGSIVIEHDGSMVEDHQTLSEMFGKFFLDKVKGYSHLESRLLVNPVPKRPIKFSPEEICNISVAA